MMVVLMERNNKYYNTQENMCDQIVNYIKVGLVDEAIKVKINSDFNMNIFFNKADSEDINNMLDIIISISRRFYAN